MVLSHHLHRDHKIRLAKQLKGDNFKVGHLEVPWQQHPTAVEACPSSHEQALKAMLAHGSCHDRKMRPNGPCLVVGSTFGHLQTCRSSLATVPKQLESTKPQAAQLSTPLWDAMSVHLRPTERLVLKLSRPLRASTASCFVPKKGFAGFALCVEAFDGCKLRAKTVLPQAPLAHSLRKWLHDLP